MSFIPIIQIQHDFLQVLNDVTVGKIIKESVWIRINGLRYNITIVKNNFICKSDNDNDNDSKEKHDEIQFEQLSSTTFQIQIQSSSNPIQIEFPKLHFSSTESFNLQSHNITTINLVDTSIIIGDSKGSITKLESIPTTEKTKLIPKLSINSAHYLDITDLLVFPSGKVIITVSLDYLIKLWSLETGDNPRIFKGLHKKPVTNLKLIGFGRNFISSSIDGSCCIWECGSGDCVWSIRRVKDVNDPVLAIDIDYHGSGESENNSSSSSSSSSFTNNNLFFDCQGKVLYAAHQSGIISVWDLNSRCSLGEFNGNITTSCEKQNSFDSINSISISVHNQFIIIGIDNKLKCFNKVSRKLLWERIIGFSKNECKLKLKIIKIKINNGLIYCLTSLVNLLFSVELNTGNFKKHFVGYDNQINDFIISHDNNVYVAGKKGLLIKYQE